MAKKSKKAEPKGLKYVLNPLGEEIRAMRAIGDPEHEQARKQAELILLARGWQPHNIDLYLWRPSNVYKVLKSAEAEPPPPKDGASGWSKWDQPKQWARVFKLSWKSIKRRIKNGSLTAEFDGTKRARFDVNCLPPGYSE